MDNHSLSFNITCWQIPRLVRMHANEMEVCHSFYISRSLLCSSYFCGDSFCLLFSLSLSLSFQFFLPIERVKLFLILWKQNSGYYKIKGMKEFRGLYCGRFLWIYCFVAPCFLSFLSLFFFFPFTGKVWCFFLGFYATGYSRGSCWTNSCCFWDRLCFRLINFLDLWEQMQKFIGRLS